MPSPPWASCGGCATGWTRGSSCPRRCRAAPWARPGRPRGAAPGGRRLDGRYEEDDWGFDEEFVELVFPFFEFLYERWWRVKTTGIEHVPAHGRALLAGNHAGILPWDATMISFAIQREHLLPRFRFLVLNWAFDLPFISVAMRKVGGVVASPCNAMQLLQRDELVAVFPEGEGRRQAVQRALPAPALRPRRVRGDSPAHGLADRARRRGRQRGDLPGRLRRRAPRRRSYSRSRRPSLARAAGAVPLPSKWRIEFCEPIPTDDYGPEAAEDPRARFRSYRSRCGRRSRRGSTRTSWRGPAFCSGGGKDVHFFSAADGGLGPFLSLPFAAPPTGSRSAPRA